MSLLDIHDDGWADQMADEAGGNDPKAHPRVSDILIGHQAQQDLLLKAYDDNKMAHGWLFTGPTGVGKATFAYHLAKFLMVHGIKSDQDQTGALFGDALPTDPATTLVCNQSIPSVSRIRSAGHADLMTLEADSKGIKVENVRDVVKFLQKTSAEGGWRIVIIDGADKMNRSAQNALLKVLEEPPKNTILILIAETPSKLLPTIHSRTRKLVFPPLDNEPLFALADYFGLSDDQEKRDMVLRLCDGSFSVFVDLIDQDNETSLSYFLEMLATYPAAFSRKKLYQIADTICAEKQTISSAAFLHIVAWWSQKMIKSYVSGIKEPITQNENEVLFLNGLDDTLSEQEIITQLIHFWEKTVTLGQDLSRAHLDPRSVILSVFFIFETLFKKKN